MATFTKLIRFEAREDSDIYFADSPSSNVEVGNRILASDCLDGLLAGKKGAEKTIGKLLAPLPNPSIPIYCVGLNFHSHAKEAGSAVLKAAPLWTKPCTALANPDETIPVNKFCGANGLDYEGELVFVTSKTCKDISREHASEYILGYTVGNDLSCRLQQMPDMCGGQYFFAKAFDHFAPIGPALISPQVFENGDAQITTKVNGETVQHAKLSEDMIFAPAEILSRMSQGTTIPAGTAVMTGTPAGVAAFRKPPNWLKDGDVVEVLLSGTKFELTLSNKMAFD